MIGKCLKGKGLIYKTMVSVATQKRKERYLKMVAEKDAKRPIYEAYMCHVRQEYQDPIPMPSNCLFCGTGLPYGGELCPTCESAWMDHNSIRL